MASVDTTMNQASDATKPTKPSIRPSKRSRSLPEHHTKVKMEPGMEVTATTSAGDADAKKVIKRPKKVIKRPKKGKRLNPLFSQRTMPACMCPPFSGTLNDRPHWHLTSHKHVKDHHSRVLSDNQVKIITRCYEAARDDLMDSMKDGIPTLASVSEARSTIKDVLALTGPFVASSFKMLGTTALNGSVAFEEDPAVVMSFLAAAQRQMTSAAAGAVDGAMAVIARSLQGPLAKDEYLESDSDYEDLDGQVPYSPTNPPVSGDDDGGDEDDEGDDDATDEDDGDEEVQSTKFSD